MATDTRLPVLDLIVPSVDGLPLAARLWTVDRPRAVLVVSHGLGEHGGAYEHVAESLGRSAGVEVLAIDFRGHGRSPGKRGVVGHYDDLSDDLRAAVSWAAAERPGLPRFVLGHSNGGQVVLRAVLDGGLDVSGLILSNPALRVATPIPRWKLKVGRLLRRIAPGVTLETAVDLTTLTRDPAMLEERRIDPLRHSRINGPLFFGLVEGGEAIARRAGEITLPLLLLLGGSDPIIDPIFTSSFFDRLGSADKTRLTYPDMLHEPLNDLNRAAPLAAIGLWLCERLLPGKPVR
jgi:alpha-beta hydrolase superfamily lysophospholipase